MDNFMDKLAKRFNAGEIIKANGAAEARDMKRMQEREAEYEKMMQEMRRLNLKNIEVTEQVQQLIQCGIEQFEGYQSFDLSSLQDNAQSAEQLEAETAKLSEILETQNTKIAESVDAQNEKMDAGFNAQSEKMDAGFSTQSEKMDAGFNAQSEKMDAGFTAQSEKMDNGFNAQSIKFTDINTKLDDLERNIYSRLLQNEGEIAQALREIKDGMGDDNRLDAAFARLETTISTGRYTTENAITVLQGEVDAMREILQATQKSVDDGQRRLEDHVHKENVRVYRNVQAAVADEISAQNREFNTRLDKIENSSGKATGALVFAILTFLLVLADIGLQVANMLHLF